MAGLLDLVTLAQNHTWFMVVLLWVSAGAGFRLVHGAVRDNASDLESLESDALEIQEQVHKVDLKQDHIVQRQEFVLDRLGMNEQDVQELRESTAALDERTDNFRNAHRHRQRDQPSEED